MQSLLITLAVINFALLILINFLPITTVQNPGRKNWRYAGGFLKSFLVFRNRGHKSYSRTTLIESLILLISGIIFGNTVIAVAFGLAIANAFFALLAIYHVYFAKKPCNAFSIDCIWFNILIAVFEICVAWMLNQMW